MIEAIDVHFQIQEKLLVAKSSIKVEPGKLTAILGANGAGKSTLIKLISQELRMQKGYIRINGESAQKMGVCHQARLRAVMAQHTHVNFPFTVQEIVEMGLVNKIKNGKEEIHLEEVMKLTQTWELKERKIQELSGGERQRVHFARTLLQVWEKQAYPRYLLLDEPTSSLDIAQQHHLLEIASKMKTQNMGVLAIIHDLNLASQFADEIILMKSGKVLIQAPVREVMTPFWLEKAFDHPIRVIEQEDLAYPIIVPGRKEHSRQHIIKTA